MASWLNDIADRSAQKSGASANYIQACQALKDDLMVLLEPKFNMLTQELQNLHEELRNVKMNYTSHKPMKKDWKRTYCP